jgi:broad specificity phosphatase PhoE
MHITAIRHGETEGNILHRVESHTGGTLTETGRERARAAADQLAGRNFDIVYISDLQCCVQTATIIIERQ